MTTPKWAQDLMLNALLWWESQGNEVPNISLEWRHRTGKQSTGTAYGDQDRIRIRQGTDRVDAKLVLLHEIAHQIAKVNNPYEHHTQKFWNIAWQLYRWAKLPVRYCLWREVKQNNMVGGWVGAQVAYQKTKRLARKS